MILRAYGRELRRGPIAVSEDDSGHSSEGAEQPQLSRYDIKLIRSVWFRVERNIFRMLDERPLAILQAENEFSERNLADETVNLRAN